MSASTASCSSSTAASDETLVSSSMNPILGQLGGGHPHHHQHELNLQLADFGSHHPQQQQLACESPTSFIKCSAFSYDSSAGNSSTSGGGGDLFDFAPAAFTVPEGATGLLMPKLEPPGMDAVTAGIAYPAAPPPPSTYTSAPADSTSSHFYHAAPLTQQQQQQHLAPQQQQQLSQRNGLNGWDTAMQYESSTAAYLRPADFGSSTPTDSPYVPITSASSCGGEPAVLNYQKITDSQTASTMSTKAFVPCKVCGDKASGYHYGVTSCEGCKGFFRRSIQKQIEYRCLRDGKCMVFRLNRNRCQYCRFKKCLAVGMSRDSVRYGRVPKRARDRQSAEMAEANRAAGDASMGGGNGGVQHSNGNGDMMEADSELEKRQLAVYDIILSVSQAHHCNCAYTEDKMKNIALRPIHFPLDGALASQQQDAGSNVSSSEQAEHRRVAMWQTMALYITPEIQRVVEFAKRIPGFAELPQEDQLVLIKSGFFEVWLVRLARQFNGAQHTLTLCDGSFVHRDQLHTIYSPELVNNMFTFAASLNALHLSDGEVGLFTAVLLLSQERTGLSSVAQTECLQEQLTEALKLQLSRSHSSDPHIFSTLLLKLPELSALGAQHNGVLDWYRQCWHRLSLPPLFAEIYDINKVDHPTSQPPVDTDTAGMMPNNALPLVSHAQ